MIYKLTHEVWWGDACRLNELSGTPIKSVLAVGGNLENLPPECTPMLLPERMPYLRLAQPDNEPVTWEYFNCLLAIIKLLKQEQMLPVFVHCRACQMRSPIAAVVTAAYLVEPTTSESRRMAFDQHMTKAKALRPDILHNAANGEMMAYCDSMIKRWQETFG